MQAKQFHRIEFYRVAFVASILLGRPRNICSHFGGEDETEYIRNDLWPMVRLRD